MREIFFLFFFSSIFKCFTATITVKEMLATESEVAKRIKFLTTDHCRLDQNHKLIINDDELSRSELSKHKNACLNTIGFAPINENKVKVFLTANNADANKVLEITLSYKADASKDDGTIIDVYSCNDKGEKIDIVPQNFPLKITEEESEILNLKIIGNNTDSELKEIVQCKSFNLESQKTKIVVDFFNELTTTSKSKPQWILKVQLKDIHDQKLPTTMWKGEIKTQNSIFLKMRCDPEKLIAKPPPANDSEKEHIQLTKMAGAADELISWTGNLKNTLSYIIGRECEDFGGISQAKMMYKTSRTVTGLAKKVECVNVNADGFAASWKYRIETVKNGFFDLNKSDSIEVTCTRYTCRMCDMLGLSKVLENLSCQPEDKCKLVAHEFPRGDDLSTSKSCFSIKTDQCKVIKLNQDGFIKNTISTPTNCQNGNFKVNGETAVNMTCADQFPVKYNDITDIKIKNRKLVSVVTEKPRNCMIKTGCHCKNNTKYGEHQEYAEYLAIESNRKNTNNQSYWLRVKTLKFDPTENEWQYSRQLEDGTVGNYTMKDRRAVRCVANPSLSEERIEEAKQKKQTTMNIIVIVNIMLIPVFAAITIPGVIFYVNARIKKREALKAAKKDKKKEEHSGDKKNDEKKPEEKKNEA